MNYQIALREVDAHRFFALSGPSEDETREEFEESLRKFEGRFFIQASLCDLDDNRTKSLISPHYSREEGSAEAFKSLGEALSVVLNSNEQRKQQP